MRKKIFTLLTILWMIVIFNFSAQNATESTEISNSFGEMVGMILVEEYDTWSVEKQKEFAQMIDYPIRKGAHIAEYAILGLLLAGAIIGQEKVKDTNKKEIVMSIIIGVIYACSDEIHQIFVPGRAGMIRDVLIDSVGVVLGVLGMDKILSWFLNRQYKAK